MRRPVGYLSGELTRVRAATAADVELLVAWHLDPDVARFWDGTTYTRDEMIRSLGRSDIDPYIVEEGGEPVGFIQAWQDDDDERPAGLDMFLIPSARDRGLGPDAARTLARWLLGEGGLHRLTADPYVWNPRAIRAWEKAGFQPVGERPADEEHSATWLLMWINSPSEIPQQD